MINRRLLTGILSVLCFTCSASSKADFVLSTRPDGTTPTINAAIGDTISFDLYLVETNTSRITQDGLLSFGLRGTFSSATLQGLSVDISPQFPIIGNGADFSTPGQVDFFGGSLNPPKVASVQLANVKFRVIGDGTTTIRFGDLDSNFDDFSLGDQNLTSLDSALFGPAFDQTYGVTVQITAVPEPGTFALVVCAGSIVILRRWRISQKSRKGKIA